MTSQAPLPERQSALESFLSDIEGVPFLDDPVSRRRKSRDYFWYSPILNEELADCLADVIVVPRDEADVIRVAAACVKHRIPLTPRGAGTGNYGQAVPLSKGVVLDMTAMSRIILSQPGRVRVEPGARLVDIDRALEPAGWELRMHPSTKRTATIGGFVAGGSGGVGSVTYGGLREPGNILSARIVTMEPEPRVLDLDADAAQKINRAYGTTGIITRLDMPLAPVWPWVDIAIEFDDFADALRCGYEVALADGIVKKLVTCVDAPLPTFYGPIGARCAEGCSLMICMIAEPFLACFFDLLGSRGRIVLQQAFDEGPARTPLYEYTWNHATLQVLKADRSVSYLQCLFPAERVCASIIEMTRMFSDEQIQHVEFIRFGGRVTASALPIIRFRDAQRLGEIIAGYEAHGVMIANPHVYTLEDGSRHKRADADQLGFKYETDPLGLLNPGKMRSFVSRR